mmetsp:Transcript_23446/g.35391  ORF Transcript_23446/g.35391 Transcript_23446/m.35391 type:complete len:269 (+) Transcript_23446:63-869(+)|eukprot:CAMPEP_0206454430 /NCGR_PEP_ID=MMETSP0324_2-20121206/21130_1 /ASSEMBLY_ACC=CAM_ASM_000836 /TAXON_ID=2866 /ORGANISM="Crypthecodinium cohnii, Strain Seligo" /LENGTH=268 /DNA_ID=CAMNT_0053924897 /DNA_START=42 /DNA_END=848 /DNA_ORIENTATION=+
MAAPPSDHVVIGNLPADLDDDAFKQCFEAYGTIKWIKLFSGKGGATKNGMIEFDSIDEATWLVENLDGNVPLGLETEVSVKFKPPKGAAGGGGGAGGGYGKSGPTNGDGGNRFQPYGGKGGGCKGGGGKGGCFKGGKGGGKMGFSGEPCSIKDVWRSLLRAKALPGGSWANDERTVVVSGLPADTTEHDLLLMFTPFGAILPGGVRVTLNEDGTAKGSGMINFLSMDSTKSAIETLNQCVLPDGRSLRVRQFSDTKGKGKGKKPADDE